MTTATTKSNDGRVLGRVAEYVIPVDGNTFKVAYNRTDGPVDVSVRGKITQRVRKILECGLFINNNLVAISRSICRPPDKFDEKKAKTMTLGRILSANMGTNVLTKNDKKVIMTAVRNWKQYARERNRAARQATAPPTVF